MVPRLLLSTNHFHPGLEALVVVKKIISGSMGNADEENRDLSELSCDMI